MGVAVRLLNKMKAEILQCLGCFCGPEKRLRVNPEGGPHEKAIPFIASFLFLSTFGHVLDSCPASSFPSTFSEVEYSCNLLSLCFALTSDDHSFD